mgnify:CR=1 FL=1
MNIKAIQNIATPFYLFDVSKLKQRINYLKEFMPNNVRLCYAMKANSFVLKYMEGLITRFEICSYGEFKIAEASGVAYDNMVISGVYKDDASMKDIITKYKVGEVITIESLNQLTLVDLLTRKLNISVDVIIRLTSNNQFGMCESELENIINKRESFPFLNIKGIQFFSGTQKSLKKIIREIGYIDNYIKHLNNDLGFEIQELELGLGFMVDYFENEKEFLETEYLRAVKNELENMEYKGLITLELGRSIVACCGDYYTKVVDTKKNSEGNFAILDGGMNHLVYYGQMMAMKHPFLSVYPKKEGRLEEWNLCGALCTVNDLLVKKIEVNNLEVGDIFVFHNVGAYSVTEGISLFLSRDLPKVVILENDNLKIVRENIPTYKLNMVNGGE